MTVAAVPKGMHTITPQITVDGGEQAIAWYQQAFAAEVIDKAMDPSGKKVMHASLRIGNSTIFVNDTFPEMGGATPQAVSLWIYADDIDAWWSRATATPDAKISMPIADMFWGDRMGSLIDPFGNHWHLAQHIKDMTAEEMQAAQDAAMKSMTAH